MSRSINKPALAALTGGLLLSTSAFAATPLVQGYMLGAETATAAQTTDAKGTKAAEAKCGAKAAEAKCGAHKAKAAEGKCGEGKCGAGKAQPGPAKAAEGKCGEGKCGASKAKAAEGKCGGKA